MFNKLRTRLTVIFVILTLIPVLVVSLILGYRGFTQSFNDSLQRQQLLNDRANQAITDTFALRVNELSLLGNTPQFAQLTTAEQRGLLGNLLHNQAYNDISIIDAAGREKAKVSLFATVGDADLTDLSRDPLFQQTLKEGKPGYSSIFFDALTGEPLLTIAIPFYDQRSGSLSHVIFANFRFYLVWSIVAQLETQGGQGLQVFLTDTSGTVIAHANPTIVYKKQVFKLPAQDGQMIGLDGVTVALVAQQKITLGEQQFIIVSQEAVDIALKGATETAISAALIALLTILVAIGVIIVVARQIVQPIEQLSEVAQSIRDGNLDAQTHIERSDEIGKMAQTFDSMTAQLKQNLKGLKDQVEELERARIEREKLIKDLHGARRLAEENSRLKSEFLSTMSHELRTPLNAIEGFTGIMLNKLAGTSYNDKTESFLTRIRSNSKRLLQLINDFLDLSRIEAGRLELANQPFSPTQLAKRWQNEIGVLAEKKGIQFVVNLDSSLPETVFGDEESISKIGLNLLSNAIKFTEQGQIILDLECTDGTWGFTVKDTGIGIPPHAREFIFEEFRQVDQTSKRKYGGTGLGLAIVQKYTRAMGGTVTVQSELGKGSTFSVSLPLKVTA